MKEEVRGPPGSHPVVPPALPKGKRGLLWEQPLGSPPSLGAAGGLPGGGNISAETGRGHLVERGACFKYREGWMEG